MRLVVPRAPEVAGELEPLLGEAELLRVEEYLLERDYVAPANLVLTWGTYTITPAGFHWLEGGLLEEPLPTQQRLRELANRPGEEEAFESALLANLEEERRLMEEVERESSTRCARSRQEEPRRAPRRSGRGQRAAPPGTGGGAMAEGTERRR